MYPALAVLQAAQDEWRRSEPRPAQLERGSPENTLEFLWVGSQEGMEEALVTRLGIAYAAIPAAGVHGVGLSALPGNLAQIYLGWRQARRILKSFKPDALLFTGGYVAVPMALAGRHYPIMLYVPDIEPGLALKFLARFSDRIVVTAEESRRYFPASADVTVTGYPVRNDLLPWDEAEAYRLFDFSPELCTLFAFGGSKGARSINRALMRILPSLLEDMQVIHLTGHLDWPEVQAFREELPKKLTSPKLLKRYCVFPYLHEEIGAAMTIADFVLSRAGASVLGEFPRFGLPAILVPYPHAWRYQQVNAEYLHRRGAALILPDHELEDRLLQTVRELFYDAKRRKAMSLAMRSLDRPQAAHTIWRLLNHLVEEKTKRVPS